MPIVRESIEEETGIVPSSEVHPDEAVAIGAAYSVLDALQTAVSYTHLDVYKRQE